MVRYFSSSGIQGRATGTVRALGGNALVSEMSIRRDTPAREFQKKPKKVNVQAAKPKRTLKQHPLSNDIKRARKKASNGNGIDAKTDND